MVSGSSDRHACGRVLRQVSVERWHHGLGITLAGKGEGPSVSRHGRCVIASARVGNKLVYGVGLDLASEIDE